MATQSVQSSSINFAHKELTKNDLAVLCDILNPVASKCHALGLKLGVKETRMRTIIADNRNDCEAQLREIISERLKQDSPLKWHDIITALRSPSVNHHDVARHIQSWYKSPALDFQQHPSSDIEQHLSFGGDRPYPMLMMGQTTVNSRSVPTSTTSFLGKIMAGFSWLLPSREPSHREISQPPTQMIGPTPLRGQAHGEVYLPFEPVTGPVDIKPPDSATSGIPYRCLPYNMGLYQTAHSNTSTTAYTPHRRATAYAMESFVYYVKCTYKQREIERNLDVLKWPPTPSKIFINLACIDWESLLSKEEADEYTRAMVEDGNIDVIMKEKRNIDFDDIVRDLPPVTASEKVVLVEGAPGVGKSTFAWEFCRRWERGEIAQQYQLVLLLRLRDERMSRAKSLRNLIHHSSESVCKAVVKELESTLGVNTLIILEGFDELPDPQRKESSIFLQLILGYLLLHATIMITSRPWATGALLAQFIDRIFLHVEILGFTEENITKYVTSVFTGEGKKTASAIDQSVGDPNQVKKNIDDVMAYISKYPQIKACMYIPLNAVIVVRIHQESKKGMCILPKTLTELYFALTQTILLRYLYGNPDYKEQQLYIDSFEKDLPTNVYKQLLTLCKVAYDGVCREGRTKVQLIFSDRDLGGCETLGFMQSVSEMYTLHGRKSSHNFLHLTFQEFLAAFFISTMSSAQQLKHFQRHKDGRLRVVLRFLAGLTKLNKVTPDELRSLLGEPTVEQSYEYQTQYYNPMRPDVCVSAYHTNWLFEAQNSELLQSLFHNHTASFTFTRGMLLLEYYSVGYCIGHSHSKWSLAFDEDTEEEKLHMLVSGAKTGNDHHKVTLRTTSRYMTLEKMHIIMKGLSPCVEALYLKVPDTSNSLSLPPSSTLHILELQIDDNNSAFNISCDLPFSSLEVLIISSSCKGATLGPKIFEAISKLLSSTTSLKEFHLSPNIRNGGEFSIHVSNKDMEVITNCLNDNLVLPLVSLDIDCKCTFTTTATWSLAQFITRNTTLQYLKIRIDTFEDVYIFAKVLRENIALPLKSLDIDCKCTFTAIATRSLVQFITRSTTLQYIRICHVTFSAQGLIELTEAIHHCYRLQKKLEKLECSEDVVNLRHMFKKYPDMQKSITDWDE